MMSGMGMRRLIELVAAGLFTVPVVCAAQNAPPPSTTNPQSKPGGTIVANPTEDERKRGWNAGMRWTREQFQEFCAKLNASKCRADGETANQTQRQTRPQ
jgi:hypothetical protein